MERFQGLFFTQCIFYTVHFYTVHFYSPDSSTKRETAVRQAGVRLFLICCSRSLIGDLLSHNEAESDLNFFASRLFQAVVSYPSNIRGNFLPGLIPH